MDWLIDNTKWIFSGIGVLFLSFLGNKFLSSRQDQKNEPKKAKRSALIDKAKLETKILFIDDDTKFKVVNILKKAGWVNTKSVKDITSLDSSLVRDTNIFFVDIQGVGLSLGFKDEGLGLALALKGKYQNKKVIIYSSETKGERFHQALRTADTFLAKNAEPYEFQQLVEEYSLETMVN